VLDGLAHVLFDLVAGDGAAHRADHGGCGAAAAPADLTADHRTGDAAGDGAEARAFTLLLDLANVFDGAAVGADGRGGRRGGLGDDGRRSGFGRFGDDLGFGRGFRCRRGLLDGLWGSCGSCSGCLRRHSGDDRFGLLGGTAGGRDDAEDGAYTGSGEQDHRDGGDPEDGMHFIGGGCGLGFHAVLLAVLL
jgi:hypothetical protein